MTGTKLPGTNPIEIKFHSKHSLNWLNCIDIFFLFVGLSVCVCVGSLIGWLIGWLVGFGSLAYNFLLWLCRCLS